MTEEKTHKISLGTAICIFIIIILLIALTCLGIYVYKIKNNSSETSSMNENQLSQNISNNTTKNDNQVVDQKQDFEDALVDYIIDSIKTYANNGSILKGTTGDILADKLSEQEVENNKNDYKQKIKSMLNDNSIFSAKFIRNDKECCTYNLEKILNKLDLATHMGAEIGCYDTNNQKIYEYGKTEIEDYSPNNTNRIKYFGYETNDLVNNILDEIEKCADNGYILKDTTDNSTTSKLTLTEAQNNRTSYSKKINEIIDDGYIFPEVYFENNKLIVKCSFKELFNNLGLKNNMSTDANVDEEGLKTFVLE